MIEVSGQVLDHRCATVVYLLQDDTIKPHFYLAKRNNPVCGKNGEPAGAPIVWNGYGGRWKPSDKTIFDTAERTLKEDSGGVVLKKSTKRYKNLSLVGDITFFWPGNTSRKWDMKVFFFVTKKWLKEPEETEKMKSPKVFSVDTVPFLETIPADESIIRSVMSGKIIEGSIRMDIAGDKSVRLTRELRIRPNDHLSW